MMMLSEVDRDGDGCISLEEFGAISSAFGPACDTELRDAFASLTRIAMGRSRRRSLIRSSLPLAMIGAR